MIPKIIHYCWFGGNELPEEVKKCINSWEKVMPEYKIIRWDESNYDVTKNRFIKEAYENKKWAFVSDYARLDILYNYGGVYLDTDVEVIKSFDDLLKLDGFCGFEQNKNNYKLYVNMGLAVGMKKEMVICKKLLDSYSNLSFENYKNDLKKITCPILQTIKLQEDGLILENKKQKILGLTVFPTDYFCPMNQYTGKTIITKNTYSIHHYSATWCDDIDKKRKQIRNKYSKYGIFVSNIISTWIVYYQEYGILKMWSKILKKIQKNDNGGR